MTFRVKSFTQVSCTFKCVCSLHLYLKRYATLLLQWRIWLRLFIHFFIRFSLYLFLFLFFTSIIFQLLLQFCLCLCLKEPFYDSYFSNLSSWHAPIKVSFEDWFNYLFWSARAFNVFISHGFTKYFLKFIYSFKSFLRYLGSSFSRFSGFFLVRLNLALPSQSKNRSDTSPWLKTLFRVYLKLFLWQRYCWINILTS